MGFNGPHRSKLGVAQIQFRTTLKRPVRGLILLCEFIRLRVRECGTVICDRHPCGSLSRSSRPFFIELIT